MRIERGSKKKIVYAVIVMSVSIKKKKDEYAKSKLSKTKYVNALAFIIYFQYK